mgnify:CR=1 FL=1
MREALPLRCSGLREKPPDVRRAAEGRPDSSGGLWEAAMPAEEGPPPGEERRRLRGGGGGREDQPIMISLPPEVRWSPLDGCWRAPAAEAADAGRELGRA